MWYVLEEEIKWMSLFSALQGQIVWCYDMQIMDLPLLKKMHESLCRNIVFGRGEVPVRKNLTWWIVLHKHFEMSERRRLDSARDQGHESKIQLHTVQWNIYA